MHNFQEQGGAGKQGGAPAAPKRGLNNNPQKGGQKGGKFAPSHFDDVHSSEYDSDGSYSYEYEEYEIPYDEYQARKKGGKGGAALDPTIAQKENVSDG